MAARRLERSVFLVVSEERVHSVVALGLGLIVGGRPKLKTIHVRFLVYPEAMYRVITRLRASVVSSLYNQSGHNIARVGDLCSPPFFTRSKARGGGEK